MAETTTALLEQDLTSLDTAQLVFLLCPHSGGTYPIRGDAHTCTPCRPRPA